MKVGGGGRGLVVGDGSRWGLGMFVGGRNEHLGTQEAVGVPNRFMVDHVISGR